MTNVEKAYTHFLIRLKSQKKIRIQHYQFGLKSKKIVYFSFIGYATSQEGLHGIHYWGKKNKYFFGTVNDRFGLSGLFSLNYSDIEKIPKVLKEAFKKSADKKGDRFFMVEDKMPDKIESALRIASRSKLFGN